MFDVAFLLLHLVGSLQSSLLAFHLVLLRLHHHLFHDFLSRAWAVRVCVAVLVTSSSGALKATKIETSGVGCTEEGAIVVVIIIIARDVVWRGQLGVLFTRAGG